MRLYGLVSALAAFHQISVLAFVTRAESPVPALQGLRGLCERVVTVQNDRLAVRGISRRALQLGTALSPRSFRDLVHHRGSLQAAIGRMAQDASYDVVQVEHSFMARYAFPPEAVVVLDEHNVEYEIPLRSVTVDGSLPRKLYDRLEYLKVRAEEERAWRRVDACAVTSSRDAVTIRRAFPHALVDVVPNGVDTRYFSPGDRPSEPATLLFFGTIASYPNVDALLFFVREVLPLIRRAHPAVRLVIVGPAPPPEIRRLSGPDVVVMDAVPDLRPYLERATAVIAPLRVGGGTRLKILEAMAMGRPVVSTSLGAEGLEVTDGKDLLLADTPRDFALQIGRILAEPDLGRELGAAGRRLVERSYDWTASARKLEGLYATALRGRTHAGIEALLSAD